MKQKNIICCIDVGTTKIVAIVAEFDEMDKFSIIGIGESKSNGLERGVIVNINETIESLDLAISMAQEQSGYDIESVYVGISGDHINGMNATGIVSVGDSNNGNFGSVIDFDDKKKVLESAQAMALSGDRRILHVLSKHYTVDERNNIEDPVGLTGSKLQAEVHLITSSMRTENDFKTCFDALDIIIDAFVLEPLASSYSILSRDEKKLGSIMIDIGGGTTDVVIWEEGGISNTKIIPLGGEIITKDIARVLGCTIKNAESLKINNGSALNINEEKEIIIEDIEGQLITTTSSLLSSIIEERVKEILNEVKYEIESRTQISNLSFGIILTGGGSQLKNISQLAEKIFNSRIRIGKPASDLESVDKAIINPKYSTAIGMIQYAIDHIDELSENDNNTNFGIIKNFFRSIKELFTN